MLSLRPALRLLQAPLRCWAVPKAHVSAKPAETPTSPAEQAVGLSFIFITFLGPAGWILSHVENYKKRPRA
uniref:Cytochrome c oxidase subunit 8B, mitochondrial n=1 Tax=Ateles belzebuth TaxID=9507 RepID=COX8B_ATEBE|nr:RecName: Full=Cytochrome c oxidase subunit 8B, mitochondrial; AltName: Full=Cytochrome c oxidase polypeptide VIII-heart; AltName: Full=Cytochrome c oxidase subunit 8-1; AltName: Full=Cytochrome c oxidase subunit 8H; Flags: Precursor [Ateles belzebuth]AAP32257.1 cytochrome c oxidase subunit VIII heart form [Ateles belzebuth]